MTQFISSATARRYARGGIAAAAAVALTTLAPAFLLPGAGAAHGAEGAAQPVHTNTDIAARPALDIANEIPKFEKFYADAQGLGEAARWALWKKEYAIAAVPPTPQGMALARAQLDAAWPRYATLVPRLSMLEARAEKSARALFAATNRLYGAAGKPIHTRVVLFVGQYDDNAFTIPAMNGRPVTVVAPVQGPMLQVRLAHELAHSVNFQLAQVRNSFGAPIGETAFLEGLAMHASKALVPGHPDTAYTEMASQPGWLEHCRVNRDAILKGILPYLDKSGDRVATRFTFGLGTTGMHREVYCAGWLIVGSLLASGKTFPQLARVPESRMMGMIEKAVRTAEGS